MERKPIAPLNDTGFRLILIPFFGIAIPLATGMAEHLHFSWWKALLSYAYTISISFVIWQGNRYLLFTLRHYFNWFNKPVRKIIVLLLSVSFYTIPVSTGMLIAWYFLFAGGVIDRDIVIISALTILVCVFFIVHVYETVFLVRESASEMLRNEQLERSKAEAELEALKSRIDPHFIFNSLNTLSHLIEEQPAKAKAFNDNLAEVYRYILQYKGRDLVLLREEIDFLENYFSLLKIRFEDAIQLKIETGTDAYEQYLIPPISLQVLIENAIKHNQFSDTHPLIIEIQMINDELVVHNDIRKKLLRKTSSKIGLSNLGERYRLITRKAITVKEEEKDFTVHLPILKIA